MPHAHVADIFRHAGEDFVKTILRLLGAVNTRNIIESTGGKSKNDSQKYAKAGLKKRRSAAK